MKRIPFAVRPTWMALGVAVVLAAAGGWLPSRSADYGPTGAGASRGDHEAPASGERPARAVRRVRASSSMPYFSFARALRARG